MAKRNKSENNAPAPTGEIPTSLPSAPVPPAAEGTVVARAVPNLAMMFARAEGERRVTKYSLPPIVKPSSVGPGVGISGKIVEVIPSPLAAYKSELLLLTHHSGQQFCFPLTAVVRKACLRRVNSTKTELTVADKKALVGQEIEIVGLGATKTADGQRTVNLFEVGFVEA